MVNALIYKEWLKLRWILLLLSVFSLVFLINTWADIYRSFRLQDASLIWASFILGKDLFYKGFMYLNILMGISLGVAQFIPEIHRDRFKLTLRLPLKESYTIFSMIMSGMASLLCLQLFNGLSLSLITSLYFPEELITNVWSAIIPWMLGGIVVYFATVTVLIEPTWLRKLFLALIFLGIIQRFYLCESFTGTYGYSYDKVLPVFILITVLSALPVYYSAHRYQKGVA